jgi:autotransporter-associated beta strand protein
MCTFIHRGRGSRRRAALAAAASAAIASTASLAQAQVSLTKNSSTNWTMSNGSITAIFDPQSENITSITFNGSANLLNPSGGQLDQEFAGTPFAGSPNPVMNSVVGPNNSYADVWTTENSGVVGTVTNPITYSFHYVLFANDPTIYCYEALSHASTDPATSVGQGQFLFRSNPSLFPNLYQINTGPNQLGAANAQTTIGIPSTNANFGTVTGQAGRTVQNVTYDLTGSGIAGDNGTNFFTKYDYSVYSQFFQAETMYGSQYAVTEVDTAPDTLTGGPTKQELAWTDPGILNMEFLSDHYGIDGPGTGAYPGYGYYPTTGANTTKLFGPYAFRISSTSGTTAATINQNAINAIPNSVAEFNSDTALVAAGYVNTANRGSVQIDASNSAGWSANTANNTVVLSDQGKNFQESTFGNQYTGQISANGTVNIPSVVAGSYRATLYQLGQWGETRVDGVQVKNGQISTPQSLKFTPENFGTAAPIWTIGTPDRSSHEFLNGHNAAGQDQRQFYGAYDLWAEEQTLGNQGFVSYNATATTIGGVQQAATNDPNKWIANQWYTFNPGLYDSGNSTTDNYANTAPAYVKDTAHGGTGPGPANYHGSAWQVHFTTTQAQQNQGQFVEISVGAVALSASLVVTLNGNSETWGYNNFPGPNDPMTRSGDAGFYQWAVFEFPTSDLTAAGIANDNVLTFGVSAHTNGVMYDAIRMEITNTSSNPSVTGWLDYTYIHDSNSADDVAPNDGRGLVASDSFAVQSPSVTWNNAGSLGDGVTWDEATNANWNNGSAETIYVSPAAVSFTDTNNGHYNVTLNTTVSPASVVVNNSASSYTFSGTGSITGTGTLTKSGAAMATLNTVNTYTGGTTVTGGTLIAGVAGAIGSGPVTITGGTLQLATSTGPTTISSLSVSGTGTFDVNNNHVIINYGSGADPVASIAALLTTGYNGGTWNGAGGIISTAAQSNPAYALAYADSADPGNPAGLASGTIEIKYTLAGDVNLDGAVNGVDFGILAANFNKSVSRWDQGDFNYDGAVNGVDFGKLASNFNMGASGASALSDPALVAFAQAYGLMADVPEPASLALLSVGMASFARRRRRGCSVI